jgi:hypothetical protein
MIKAENDVDVLSEEDSTDMKTDEVYIPSTFSIIKTEPEVSLVFRLLFFWFVCVSVHTHAHAHAYARICVLVFLQYKSYII